MKILKHTKFCISILLLFLSTEMHSANRYWVAAFTTGWSYSDHGNTNWSTTSGGAGGATVPGSGDIAIFTSGASTNCNIDAAVNIAGIDVQASYGGNIGQNANTITIGTSNAIFSGGTFTGGSSTITCNGTFTLSGTAFTSTSSTLTFASTVTYSSGTFTHNSGTVNYSSTGSQTIVAFNYYNLTSSSSGARVLASSGTIGIYGTFTPFTNTYTKTGSTIDYNSLGAQTITAFNYNNLTISQTRNINTNITLANANTIGIAGTFVNSTTLSGTGVFVNTGSTINYNGTGAQSVIAFNYNNLTISNAHAGSVTLANSGTIGVAGALSYSATFSSGSIVNTGSTINYNGLTAQTILAFNYNNLTISATRNTNTNVTLYNTGVIGIAGAFSNTTTLSGTGVFVNTNSTINYNGTGAQTIIAFNYYNLIISGARTTNSVTLASSGTIGVAKMFLPLATFSSGNYVNTTSTIDFNGTLFQTIPAFPYNNLTSSSTGGRAFASSGTVKIAGTFTKGTNIFTNEGISGESFAIQYGSSNNPFYSSSIVSSTISFVAGTAGLISKSTDGGITWVAQTSNATEDLYAIAFFDANNGLAVGNSGRIVKTTNGGSTWATVTSGTSEHFRSLYYVSSTLVFAGASNGVIRKSTDGGTTWTSTTTPLGVLTIYGITFTTSTIGYAVGWAGAILKTTNGGTTWTALSSGVTDQLISTKFTTESKGFAVGVNGRILKTSDAGATWTTITSGTSDILSSVAFINEATGYIVGGEATNNTGTILKTTNGGVTWSLIYPGTTRLTSLSILNQNIGIGSSLDGNPIKYSCCSDGGTVDYNGTGAQTIVAVNYHNLTLSGSRGANAVTLASSGTIGISGTLSKTFTGGSLVNTSSTVDLNGSITQTIPAFTFNNLITSNTGKKSVTGALTVQGTFTSTDGELVLAGNTLTMSSNTYSVVTRTKGYVSTTGSGYMRRPTASTSNYLFPIGYRTTNDSTDLFSITLTPGKSAAQQFDASLHSTNTGFVLNYDRTMYGIGTGGATTVLLTINTSSYNPLQLQYNIDNNANIIAVNVTDQNDNTLKTVPASFYTITSGSSLAVPNIFQLCMIYSKAILNSNMNWTYDISYDGNGYPIAEQITYADLMARPIQTLSRNVADNTVLATQTVYDSYGRVALQTLPAPVGSVMSYQSNFISDNTNTPYSYLNFDIASRLNNPDVVQSTIPGTLGAYYSDNSTEAFVATTSYPFAQKEFTSDPSSATKRVAKAGNEYRMGAANHESKGYTMISGDELRYIFGTDKSYKDSIDVSNKLTNYSITITGGIQAIKSIGIDADGKEIVNYNVGGRAIASCYTGITGACTMTTVTNTMVYAGTSSTDIHLPSANKTSLNIPLPIYNDGVSNQTVSSSDITFKLTDLNTNVVLVSGTDYTINSGTRAVTFYGVYATGSSFLRISYVYSPSLLSYFVGASIAPPNVPFTYALDYSRWSVNYYDLAGQLRKSVSPKGINCGSAGTITMSTTYNYSSKGQLVASLSPDEGLTEKTYDDEGKPRFSQTAEQRNGNKFSYINYDADGRMMETGEYTSSNNGSASVFFQNYYGAYSAPYASNTPSCAIINNIDNTGMRVLDCGDKNNLYYYPLASAEDIPSGYTYKSSYAARYLMGHITKTKNALSATWYGYNQGGQTMFSVQQMFDADYISYNATTDSQIKTVDYTFNIYNGTLTDQTYQKNGTTEKLKHNFTYDNALRLIQVDVNVAGGSALTQAKYYYYKTGGLKRKELGDKLQGIDYVYTINGQLKSINHPALDTIKDPGQDGLAGGPNAAFGKDVFGLTLDYHANDYYRTGSNMNTGGQTANLFNGMISAVQYKTRAVTNGIDNGARYIDFGGANQQLVAANVNEELINQYAYDEEYRLSTVNFGKFNNSTATYTVNSNACYKEYGTSGASGINYDANGNITTLKRNAYNGTVGLLMDDFTYTYTSNTNKLASIVDASTSTYATDFDAATSKTFTYNNDGQMTASQAEGVSTITYYNTGLTKKVTFSNSNTAEYWYDDRGQKVKTKYYVNATAKAKYTWYVSDAGGNSLAIYEYDQAMGSPAFTLVEEPIYGSGRIGTLDKVTAIIDYEIIDHLGNVRATIKGISTGVYELTSRTDYYAFGGAQPGRAYNLNTYRFNYQGQEGAPGTNWQAFDLRMLNSDLGRWFAPDPKGQFYSPYISMANNPVSGIDPDGAYVMINPNTDDCGGGNTGGNNGWIDSGYNDPFDFMMSQLGWTNSGGMGGGGFESDPNGFGPDNIGWQDFDPKSWNGLLLNARMDAGSNNLTPQQASDAASEANRHGLNAAVEFIKTAVLEREFKILAEDLMQKMSEMKTDNGLAGPGIKQSLWDMLADVNLNGDYALGVQSGFSINVQFMLGGTITGLLGTVTYLSSNAPGFYNYVGYEGFIKGGLNIEGTGSASKSYFLAQYIAGATGAKSPRSFEGKYSAGGIEVYPKLLAVGVGVGYFRGHSSTWNVWGLQMGASYGPSAGLVSFFIGGGKIKYYSWYPYYYFN